MIFELNNEVDGIYFNVFKDKKEWLENERRDLEGTYDEENANEYLAKFRKNAESVDIGYGEWKILIEGEIIVPKIKEIIKEIDL